MKTKSFIKYLGKRLSKEKIDQLRLKAKLELIRIRPSFKNFKKEVLKNKFEEILNSINRA